MEDAIKGPLRLIDRRLDELMIDEIYNNTVLRVKSYANLHKLREDYWCSKFYEISSKKNPDYFEMAHNLSVLYIVDGAFGIENQRAYFNRCIARIIEDSRFDYISISKTLKFADALLSTGHNDAIALFNLSRRNDFDEDVFKAYLSSSARESPVRIIEDTRPKLL